MVVCVFWFNISSTFSGHGVMKKETRQREKKKKKERKDTLMDLITCSHAQFLQRLATRIAVFFMCLVAFSLVGPAGPICYVAQ